MDGVQFEIIGDENDGFGGVDSAIEYLNELNGEQGESEEIQEDVIIEDEDSQDNDEEGDEESLEEDSEDNQEEADEPKKESPKAKVKELEEKLKEAELQAKEFQTKEKMIKKQVQKLRGIEEKYNNIISEGVDVAQKIVAARKAGDLPTVWKLLGINGDDVVDYYATLVPEIKPEVLKKKMAETEKQKELADIARQRSEITRKKLEFQTTNVINKFAEKLPILSSLEAEGVDRVLNVAMQMYNANHPLIRDCKDDLNKVLHKVLPYVEKDLKQRYEPLIKKFSTQKEPEKEAPKKEVTKVEEKKPEKKIEKKVVKVNPSSDSSKRKEQFVVGGEAEDYGDLGSRSFEDALKYLKRSKGK